MPSSLMGQTYPMASRFGHQDRSLSTSISPRPVGLCAIPIKLRTQAAWSERDDSVTSAYGRSMDARSGVLSRWANDVRLGGFLSQRHAVLGCVGDGSGGCAGV